MAKKGWYWPWLLAAGMGGVVVANVWMAVVATSDANGSVVEPDYYRKAVQWDSTMALRSASDALGWRAEVAIAGAVGVPARLELRLTDRDGAGVAGATVQAVLIHNTAAAHHVDLVLRDVGEGRYVAEPTLPYPGLWEVRLDALRGRERFVASRRADLTAPVPAPAN